MLYKWDARKAKVNLAKHGIAFETVEGFDWETALVLADTRRDYGEDRFVALGKIGGRLHSLVFTSRNDTIRVISLRKANNREIGSYEEG